jgi:hypothetical protein
MAFVRPRVTGGAYSRQIGDVAIRTAKMYKGRAEGGPLDNVLLEADLGWHGRIPVDSHKNTVKTHPGYYYWDNRTWVWMEDEIIPITVPKPHIPIVWPVSEDKELDVPIKPRKTRAKMIRKKPE